MRYAIRVFYLGRNYRGFQRQDDLDTIEKRIDSALYNANYVKDPKSFSYASRTDKGVDAFQQVIAFDTEERLILPKINMNLPPDIIMWASAPVPPDFSPRFHAEYRSYRYICRKKEENVNKMKEASQLFIGTHDFRNFCRYSEGAMTTRTITYLQIEEDANYLIFTVKAPAFLYQMVRRLVNCLRLVGTEQLSLDDVSSQLHGELLTKNRIGPAPLGVKGSLILLEIKYSFEFEVEPYSFERLNRFLSQKKSFHSFNERIFSEYKTFGENSPP